jgi:hypothetical protein
VDHRHLPFRHDRCCYGGSDGAGIATLVALSEGNNKAARGGFMNNARPGMAFRGNGNGDPHMVGDLDDIR